MRRFRGPIQVLSFLSFVIASTILWAEPSVSSRVSASQLSLGDSITLTVEVSGVNNINSAPDLNLPDFQVQKAGQMQSYQWINGQTSSMVTFNYVLHPVRAGQLQIPAISLQTEGKSYSSQPIPITVIPEGTAPSGGGATATVPSGSGEPVQVPTEGLRPVFMTASVDASRAYVGQQILLKVQFLRRPDARISSQPRYSEPDMTGFLVEPLQQQEFTTTINEARYDVTELRYALFPTSDGEFAIGAGQIEIAVRTQADPFDPNNFFQNFFGRNEVLKLKTRPIPITVRALPKNKPAHFTGAVGRFKLDAKVDTKELEVGKPFNLLLTVEGVGNIKTIKEPILPEIAGLRRYETLSDSKVAKDGKFLNGKKEFKILMIPQVSGAITIPSAVFSYFNPTQNDYFTEKSPEMTFQVKPGTLANTDSQNPPPVTSAGGATEGVRILEKDIRFIKQGAVKPLTVPFYRRSFFFILNGLPPLFAFMAFLVKRQSEKRLNRASYYRSRDARRKAAKTLHQARKLISQPDPIPFYGKIHAAITGYLADKFQISSAGTLWNDLERILQEKNVGGEQIQQVKYILDEADMARFATSSYSDESRETSLAQATELINQLEKIL